MVNEIERKRIVLYREDFREILPEEDEIAYKNKRISRFYVIEISKSKHKFYIAAVRIPKNLLQQVIKEHKNIGNIAKFQGSRVYSIEMSREAR